MEPPPPRQGRSGDHPNFSGYGRLGEGRRRLAGWAGQGRSYIQYKHWQVLMGERDGTDWMDGTQRLRNQGGLDGIGPGPGPGTPQFTGGKTEREAGQAFPSLGAVEGMCGWHGKPITHSLNLQEALAPYRLVLGNFSSRCDMPSRYTHPTKCCSI